MARGWFPGGCPLPQQSPKVIMLPNEVFALACRAYYEEQGLTVDERNGQFAHSPLTQKECDTGYYLLWEHHQQQGLLQSIDLGKCCFWTPHARQWLTACDYWPDNYFELWDIYERFAREQGLKNVHLCHTPEAELKRVETYKKRGHKNTHLSGGEVRARATQSMREFWTSEEGMKKRRVIRNRRAPRARTIEVEFPNGRLGVYSCVRLASIALGVDVATICRWIKGKNAPQGRFKGLKVRETEPLTP